MKVLFGIFYGKPPFGALLKRSRDDMDGLGGPHGGPPRGVAGHTWGSTLEPLLFLGFKSYALEKGLHSCAFWVFVLNYPTPWDFL